MKVFLDDERQTPEGWIRVHWPDEAIALLETGKVLRISLDHDLGDDLRGTGYDVITWIEEAVRLRAFCPPRIDVHSANPAARDRMLAGIRAIEHALTAAQTSTTTGFSENSELQPVQDPPLYPPATGPEDDSVEN